MAMTLAPVAAPTAPPKVGGISRTNSSEIKSLDDVLNKLGFKELIKSDSDALKRQLGFINLFLGSTNPPDKNKIEGELCKQLNKNDAAFYLDLDPVKYLSSSLSISTILKAVGSSIGAGSIDAETQGKVSNLLNLLPKDDPFTKKKARDINNAIKELTNGRN